MTAQPIIGQPTKIVDGRAKITGTTRYAGDITLPAMLYARFVSSPFAHANILSIDTSAALEVPGVAAVLTADDLPDIPPKNRGLLLLARSRVMFVGQPVALVLADSEAAAADGAEQVFVDYDVLPVAANIDQALADGAPLVWPDGSPGQSEEAGAHGADVPGETSDNDKPSNISNRVHFKQGNLEAGFAEADVIVERSFETSAVHQSYIEPQTVVVQMDPLSGGATVYTCTQAPYWVRENVATVLGVQESEVRVVATPVGGAFGGKFIIYQPLVALAAKITNRPVKLVLTRLEEMQAANPAMPARIWLKLGAKNDGSLTALQAHLIFDAGCYPSAPVGIAAIMLGSVYKVPHYDVSGIEVLTFKPSSGAYRAPGAPQETFAIESAMDELARKLQLDPLDFRLKNISDPGDPMIHNEKWPNIGLRQVLEALRNHPAYQNRAELRQAGYGIGVAVGGWPGGTEPASAACLLDRDGTLRINTSVVDLTGTTTSLGMLAADAFGLSPDKVKVVVGDTANAPYTGVTGGSKTMYMLGPAVIQAAKEARRQVLEIAGDEFEADPADLEIVDGKVRVKGMPDKAISLGELAGSAMDFGGKHPPVYAHGRYAENTPSPGFCAQLAVVKVDADTGKTDVERLVLIQDVGRALNPAGIEGQMMGGALQGLGWALHEGLTYDDNGQLLTASFMDYTVPHIKHAPTTLEVDWVEVPSDVGPLGARGVGEPPIIATAAAVGNAIADAIKIRPTRLPITAPHIKSALKEDS